VRDLDLRGQSEYSLLEADLEIVADILATLRSRAPPSASPEQVAEAEKIAQDVAEIAEGLGVDAARALQSGMAKAVVRGRFCGSLSTP
jgi:hypothetical protein